MASFSAIATGFAVFGQYTFGYILVDFHNLASSLSTVLRFSLGDFAYDELSVVRTCTWLCCWIRRCSMLLVVQARPRLAGLYFTLYIAIVFFVMINIIIGIITKYFDEVLVSCRCRRCCVHPSH